MSELGNLFKSKPLIKTGRTKTLLDLARENGTTFEEELDSAAKNLTYYHLPEEMKLRNILKRAIKAGFEKVIGLFRGKR